MDNIAQWLASITWPLVSRVFAAIGLGTITFTGINTALGSALDAAKSAFTGIGGDLLQILAIAGVFDVMAILSGGLISGLSWLVLKHFALQSTGSVSQ